MNIISILILVCVFLISEVRCVLISKTVNGKQCMTECVPYSDYYFCYLGWGSSNWDKCTPGTEVSLQYYTAMYEGTRPLCTSLCGKFGYDYSWCFTGEKGYWDYCSEKPGYSVNYGPCTEPCKTGMGTGYRCYIKTVYGSDFAIADTMVPLKSDIYDYCSPDPINVTAFYGVSQTVAAKVGSDGSTHCIKRSKRLSENAVRMVGVEEIAARYERMYTPVIYNHPDVPINSFVRVPAPPIRGMRDVSLTVAIRATIYYRHLTQRERIPTYINYLMEDMNALPGDERGHLLAASLGGPSHDFNFAPQSEIVNRRAGGDSYWYNIEGDMRNFLEANRTGYIEWTLVVAYGNLQENRRPTGFGLRCRQYDGNNILVRDSGDCYFSNHPSGGCPV